MQVDYPVDTARVFVAGVSNGAMMAYRFACERADRVKAVGSVAGAVVVDCQPSRPVSVLEIHGTEDPLVPYQGGMPSAVEAQGVPPYTSTPAMMQRWAELANCPLPAPATTAGPVTTESWAGCRNGSAMRLITVQAGSPSSSAPVAGFFLAIGIAGVALIVGIFEWFAHGGRWGGWTSRSPMPSPPVSRKERGWSW